MQDRLTRRGFDPELEFCAECDYHGEPNGCNRARGNCSAYAVFTDAYVRLAAYEDTRLTPDEIAALRVAAKLLESDRDAERKIRLAAEEEIERLYAALKLAQARAGDYEAEVERLRAKLAVREARWEETASDNTEYTLAHFDGIYTVCNPRGMVVCEFIRDAALDKCERDIDCWIREEQEDCDAGNE